jgi:hypothetical protein
MDAKLTNGGTTEVEPAADTASQPQCGAACCSSYPLTRPRKHIKAVQKNKRFI